jgi:hypothetical protein
MNRYLGLMFVLSSFVTVGQVHAQECGSSVERWDPETNSWRTETVICGDDVPHVGLPQTVGTLEERPAIPDARQRERERARAVALENARKKKCKECRDEGVNACNETVNGFRDMCLKGMQNLAEGWCLRGFTPTMARTQVKVREVCKDNRGVLIINQSRMEDVDPNRFFANVVIPETPAEGSVCWQEFKADDTCVESWMAGVPGGTETRSTGRTGTVGGSVGLTGGMERAGVNAQLNGTVADTTNSGFNITYDGKKGGRASCGDRSLDVKLNCLEEKSAQCKTWCE